MKRFASASVRVFLAPAVAIFGVGMLIANGGETTMFEKLSFVNATRTAAHSMGAFHLEKPGVLTAGAAEAALALPDEGGLPDFGARL